MEDSSSENALELVPPPASRVWVAFWLAIGAALLISAFLLASTEIVLALKGPLLEALASPRTR